MTVAHDVSAHDDGSCPMFDDFGLGWDYTRAGVASMFMVGSSIDFRRELMSGDPREMSAWLPNKDRSCQNGVTFWSRSLRRLAEESRRAANHTAPVRFGISLLVAKYLHNNKHMYSRNDR